MTEAYDYIIIGAGSAGCVLAEQLTAVGGATVLVLEAGPEPRTPWIRIPAGLPRLLAANSPYNWPDMTVRQAELNGRPVWIGHGRTLGGSSAINGMVYLRGHPADFERWREEGAEGWDWEKVRPHFEAIEKVVAINEPGYDHGAIRAFIGSGEACGLTAGELEGSTAGRVGRYRLTVGAGRRSSAYDAFLKNARSRRNLTVTTGAKVSRIRIEQRRATGVEVMIGGTRRTINARRDVILAAGAIDSPRLLMLSGIGPASHLQEHGIAIIHDLPGVGTGLQDHVAAGFTADTMAAGSLNSLIAGPMGQLLQGLRYLTTRGGPVTMGGSQAGALVALMPGADRPDVQLNFRPFSIAPGPKGIQAIERVPRIQATAAGLNPRSRGTVRLRSADPDVRPRIDPAYLSDQRDEDVLMAGVRLLERIFRSGPMVDIVTGVKLPEGAEDDDVLRTHIRSSAASMLHPASTCRIGRDDFAVVDGRLRVRGIAGLRIADASVMPSLPAGNTNAAAMMIGHKLASMLHEEIG